MMNSKRYPILVILCAMPLFFACDPDSNDRRIVGQMESDRVEITADFNEPIIERAVREGDIVSAGDLVVSQDKSRIDARIAQADAQLRQAQARRDELVRGPREEQIEALRASVDGARASLEFREAELKRAQEIYDRDLASSEFRDRAQAARDDASANLDRLEAQLDELLTGTTVEELRQVEAAVAQAEAILGALQIDRDRHDAIAPQAGVIDSLLLEVGERPGAGQPMAILLAGEQSHARVYVPIEMRARTTPGTRATVRVDGIDEPFEGVVRWVSSEATFTPYFALTEEDRGRLTFAAKIDIVGAADRIPDGVPVEVELHPADTGP
jgi:HlyD family secretion protein